jgi:hypothetical protein
LPRALRTELKFEISGVRTDMKQVRRDVSVIREQTAHITERVTMIEHNQKKELSN